MNPQGKKNITLPESWNWSTLGEIGIVASGGTPSTKDEKNFNGHYAWITPADLSTYKNKFIYHGKRNISEKGLKLSSAKLLPKGTILFSSRAPIGYVVIAANSISTNQGFKNLIPYNIMFNEYVYYYLKGNKQLAEKNASGTTFLEISAKNFSQLPIPISPLPEQHRIVAKIEELFTKLDAGIDALQKIKQQLKRYRQSVLKHAFEGKLTAAWREKHKDELEPASVLLEKIQEHHASRRAGRLKNQDQRKKKCFDSAQHKKELSSVETSDLPKLPEGWKWTALSQIGDLNRGKSKHRPRNDPKLYGGQYPFVQTGDVKNANGVIRNYSQTYNEEGLSQSRLWEKGTLCITIAANIADTAILGFDSCFPDSIVGFKCIEEYCNIKYVEYFFRNAKEEITKYAPATAQKNINLEILNRLVIPLSSIEEQNRIVEEIERHFSIIEKIEKTVETGIKQSERLRQSILKKAFEGKLVPQDPSDPPASELLERIKAEKAKKSEGRGDYFDYAQ